MTDLPKTARRKTIKPRWWDDDEPTIVYLDPMENLGNHRRFEIYTSDGKKLGFIEEYQSRIDTPLGKTRLVHRGKLRIFWAANGRDYWKYLPSQADAIRELLRKESS